MNTQKQSFETSFREFSGIDDETKGVLFSEARRFEVSASWYMPCQIHAGVVQSDGWQVD